MKERVTAIIREQLRAALELRSVEIKAFVEGNESVSSRGIAEAVGATKAIAKLWDELYDEDAAEVRDVDL